LAKTDSSTKKLSAVDKLTYEINTEKFNLESATKIQDKDEQISSFFAQEEQSRKEKVESNKYSVLFQGEVHQSER